MMLHANIKALCMVVLDKKIFLKVFPLGAMATRILHGTEIF